MNFYAWYRAIQLLSDSATNFEMKPLIATDYSKQSIVCKVEARIAIAYKENYKSRILFWSATDIVDIAISQSMELKENVAYMYDLVKR